MDDQQVIAHQAKKIMQLEVANKTMLEHVQRAKSHIVCIGGPLNDNKLEYSKDQLVTFWRICEELEEALLWEA